MTEKEIDKVVRTYYGDGSSGKNALTRLVDKMLTTYGGNLDHTDFYSLANEVFTKCLTSYDETKPASFDTFLWNCLSRKIKSHLSYLNRDKRKDKDAEGNFIQDESLDRAIDVDGGGDTTVGSLVMDRR